MHDPKESAPTPPPAARKHEAHEKTVDPGPTKPRPTDKESRKAWKHERAIALGDKPADSKALISQ